MKLIVGSNMNGVECLFSTLILFRPNRNFVKILGRLKKNVFQTKKFGNQNFCHFSPNEKFYDTLR